MKTTKINFLVARVVGDSLLGYYSAETIEHAKAKLEKARSLGTNNPGEIKIYQVTTTTKRELLDPSVLKV